MDTNGYTVAIVCDQPVTRAGMEALLSGERGLSVTASAGSVDELAEAGIDSFTVVVLDLPQSGANSTGELIGKVAALGRPLVLATWDRPPALLAAIRSGACGAISRRAEQSAIGQAVHVVAGGGLYLCSRLVEQFRTELSRPSDTDATGLAPREVETLRWIAMGFTHSQIAARMGLSQATIDTYAKRIRAKLNVNNKAELTRMAIELGHVAQRQARYSAA